MVREKAKNGLLGVGINFSGGFVEQEEPGVVDHCDRKARTRPFTTGKLGRKQVHPAIETHAPQDISPCIIARRSRKPPGKRGIFQNREMGEQVILLAQDAHVKTA